MTPEDRQRLAETKALIAKGLWRTEDTVPWLVGLVERITNEQMNDANEVACALEEAEQRISELRNEADKYLNGWRIEANRGAKVETERDAARAQLDRLKWALQEIHIKARTGDTVLENALASLAGGALRALESKP